MRRSSSKFADLTQESGRQISLCRQVDFEKRCINDGAIGAFPTQFLLRNELPPVPHSYSDSIHSAEPSCCLPATGDSCLEVGRGRLHLRNLDQPWLNADDLQIF